MFDAVNNTLYVAFETIGLYKLPLSNAMPATSRSAFSLLEPVTSFGRAYRATPDDEEFECSTIPRVIRRLAICWPRVRRQSGRFLKPTSKD